MSFKNKVQLITYPDSLGGNLNNLEFILENYFQNCFGGIHILPFYPSSGDRGFAPINYRKVDPDFGSWENILRLSKNYDLVYDYMINHLSRRSPEMLDFLEKKEDSEYKDFFLRFSKFWPNGEPTKEDVEKIYKRKPKTPCVEVTFADGSKDKIWCTFSDEQFDLNVKSDIARKFMHDTLKFLVDKKASIIRLDAFGFAIKKPGTSCFFLEPEMWELLEDATKTVRENGSQVLLELHDHYTIQLDLSKRGYMVYDFVLPIMLLHTIYTGDATNLKHWLKICPRNQITTLDTHDGMGVVDVKGLLTDSQIENVINTLLERGANIKWSFKEGATQDSILDAYQMNATYYSSLGEDDDAYLLARAIQFFTPGIPQVYYVGALAGVNDVERFEQTKLLTDINRHFFSVEDVEKRSNLKVVKDQKDLMVLRNSSPAFNGEFIIHDCPDNMLDLEWNNNGASARLKANLELKKFDITVLD